MERASCGARARSSGVMLPIQDPTAVGAGRSEQRPGCQQCRQGGDLGFAFSYAYQPIVDVVSGELFAHEALVRGVAGENAGSVLSQVTEDNRYRFDQACRVRAIEIATRLGMSSRLSINFLPNAVYRPEVCIRTTLEAARRFQFPIEQIIFETVEGERVSDGKWYAEVLREYQRIGFLTAIDDFGAGYAGLNLLADFQPDIVKLDMELIRSIDTRRAAQVIVRGIVDICGLLGIQVIAEGIETSEESECLQDAGIRLMQGFYFGRPRFEATTAPEEIRWPAASGRHASLDSDVSPDDPFGGVRLRELPR